MGIRDTKYFGWNNVHTFNAIDDSGAIPSASYTDVYVDRDGKTGISGTILLAGTQALVQPDGTRKPYSLIRRSTDNGETFETIDLFSFTELFSGSLTFESATSVVVDSSGTIFYCARGGRQNVDSAVDRIDWYVRRMLKSSGYVTGSFSTVHSTGSLNSQHFPRTIVVNSQDSIYVGGDHLWKFNDTTNPLTSSAVVYGSFDHGASFSFLSSSGRGRDQTANFGDIYVDGDDNVYHLWKKSIPPTGSPIEKQVHCYRSADSGSTWSSIYETTSGGGAALDAISLVTIEKDSAANRVICLLLESSSLPNSTIGVHPSIRKSTDNGGSFSTIANINQTSFSSDAGRSKLRVLSSSDSTHLYYNITSAREEDLTASISFSGDEGDTWQTVDHRPSITAAQDRALLYSGIYLSDLPNDNGNQNPIVYVPGSNDNVAFLRRGRLTANSASIGPRMLATSFGYVHEELSGATTEKFKLNNISEFPHSSGLFQMPNLVLGTTESGRIGDRDGDLIQQRFFGSVVRVLWPIQNEQTIPVKGFGDLAAGQRSGKLLTTHQPGEILDVREFDHVALYCYLTKEASGTLDSVEIRMERRPLRDTGFAVEQVVEFEESGSTTIAKVRDLLYQKEVDYGDLSIKEVAWPIDIPLTNMRELRITARHVNGQEKDENRNFIVWGRFIKSDEET